MRSRTNSSILSFLSFIIGMFLLIYLWLPLLVILLVGSFIYLLVILIMARISGKSPNFNIKIVNIKRSQDPFEQTYNRTNNNDHIDYIDSTTVEKEDKEKK